MSRSSRNSIDINDFKNMYSESIGTLIDSKKKPIALYWDKSLMRPVNMLIGNSALQEKGVEKSYIIENKKVTAPPQIASLVFIIRPNVSLVDIITDIIHQECYGKAFHRDIHIISVPRFVMSCKNLLEAKHCSSFVKSIEELPLSLLPLDLDVLSCETTYCFAEFSLFDRQNSIYEFAQGLMKFQSVFGLFPVITAKGTYAKRVASILRNLRNESTQTDDQDAKFPTPSQTDCLILLDRAVDPLTPLLQQLTYEGLIQDLYGINHGVVQLPFLQAEGEAQSKKIQLNSTEKLYAQIRDLMFYAVPPVLSKKSREMASIANSLSSSKDLAVLRRAVDSAAEKSSLEKHMSITEHLLAYVSTDDFAESSVTQQDFLSGTETDRANNRIEELIFRLAPLHEVLRLICIQCLCNGGLKKPLLQHYKHEIVTSYGLRAVLGLENLHKCGLLFEQGKQVTLGDRSTNATVTSFGLNYVTSLRRQFQLLVSLEPGENEAQLAGIYAGFVPLSVRVIQCLGLDWPQMGAPAGLASETSGSPQVGLTNALAAGKRLVSQLRNEDVASIAPSDLMGQLHGPLVNEVQISAVPRPRPTRGKRTIVVGFVGGVTHAEVSLLRQLSTFDDSNVEFIVVTTGMIDSKTFLSSMLEKSHMVT